MTTDPHTDTETQREDEGSADAARPFGGLTPSEASARAAEARRQRREDREDQERHAATTFRQRVGVSLSRLEQDELDALVKALAKAKSPGATGALTRLADQAFGRPLEGEEDAAAGLLFEGTTREQRAAIRAILEDEPIPDSPPS